MLSADIAGYTALTQSDEWSVHARAMAHLAAPTAPVTDRGDPAVIAFTVR